MIKLHPKGSGLLAKSPEMMRPYKKMTARPACSTGSWEISQVLSLAITGEVALPLFSVLPDHQRIKSENLKKKTDKNTSLLIFRLLLSYFYKIKIRQVKVFPKHHRKEWWCLLIPPQWLSDVSHLFACVFKPRPCQLVLLSQCVCFVVFLDLRFCFLLAFFVWWIKELVFFSSCFWVVQSRTITSCFHSGDRQTRRCFITELFLWQHLCFLIIISSLMSLLIVDYF